MLATPSLRTSSSANVNAKQHDDRGIDGGDGVVGGDILLLLLPVVYVHLLERPDPRPGERHRVPGLEALLPDEAPPALGEDVDPAAPAVRVPEPPRPPLAVLDVEEHAHAGGHQRAALDEQVLLGVLLRHDEAVEVADVAGRQGLLEQMFPGARRRRRLPHAPTLPRAEPRIVAGGGHVPQQHVVGLGHGGVRRRLERKLAIGRVLRCKV